MTLVDAESIWSVVVVSLMRKVVVVCVACFVDSEVLSLPIRERSIRFCGMGSVTIEWLLVVGFGWLRSVLWGLMCPIWGSSSLRALWSPYSGVCVVMVIVVFVLWLLWLLWLCCVVCSAVWLSVEGGASDLCGFSLGGRCMRPVG